MGILEEVTKIAADKSTRGVLLRAAALLEKEGWCRYWEYSSAMTNGIERITGRSIETAIRHECILPGICEDDVLRVVARHLDPERSLPWYLVVCRWQWNICKDTAHAVAVLRECAENLDT